MEKNGVALKGVGRQAIPNVSIFSIYEKVRELTHFRRASALRRKVQLCSSAFYLAVSYGRDEAPSVFDSDTTGERDSDEEQYLGAVVLLISALSQGLTRTRRAGRLRLARAAATSSPGADSGSRPRVPGGRDSEEDVSKAAAKRCADLSALVQAEIVGLGAHRPNGGPTNSGRLELRQAALCA